jgi:regulator of protease activity HflC (stomatin/prohibitin superfamily)
MFWFVITGVAVVVALGSFLAMSTAEFRTGGLLALIGTMVIWVGATLLLVFHTVDNGHIGIVKQFGSLVGTTGEGLVTTAPWQSIEEVSVQEEQNTYQMNNQEGGAGTAVSSDSQEIGIVNQVRYQLQREKAVALYRITGGHYEERILDPAVFQNTKEVTARYKAIDFAKNREQIRREIEEAINEDTEPHGIVVKNVTIKNFTLSKLLNDAIEETIQAEQNARRSEAQVKIKEAEARQAIAAAEGVAKSNVTLARGEATANRLRQQSLTPLLVQQQAIEKLNPKVTMIVCPPRTVCIPNTGTVGTPGG